MSRIGKAPIALPKGVEVKVDDKTNTVTVKGPKGTLQQTVNPDLHVAVEDGHVVVTRPSDDREHRAQHGLYRALIHNMVVGVSEGYRKEMELVGVGYRATATGQVLELSLVTKTRSSSSKAMTSSSSVRCAQRYAHSASPSLTKAKVSSLLAKLFVVNLVNRLVPNK